jgi:hypothetical protein
MATPDRHSTLGGQPSPNGNAGSSASSGSSDTGAPSGIACGTGCVAAITRAGPFDGLAGPRSGRTGTGGLSAACTTAGMGMWKVTRLRASAGSSTVVSSGTLSSAAAPAACNPIETGQLARARRRVWLGAHATRSSKSRYVIARLAFQTMCFLGCVVRPV